MPESLKAKLGVAQPSEPSPLSSGSSMTESRSSSACPARLPPPCLSPSRPSLAWRSSKERKQRREEEINMHLSRSTVVTVHFCIGNLCFYFIKTDTGVNETKLL